MGKRITELPDLGRQPIDTDLFVVEKDNGGGSTATAKMEFSRLKTMFRLQKFLYGPAVSGETQINVPNLNTAFFSVLWLGVTPLAEYNGALPVPSGMYKPDYGTNTVYFGDALNPTERVLFLFY